jgi:hypothetical protein
LTRPVVKENSWHEAAPRRASVPPTLIILGSLFVVALAIGFGVTRLLPGWSVQRVSDAEYTAVVAQLYLRDHDLSLARERLAVIGAPADALRRAVDAAQAGQLASPNDRAALDSLAAALNAPTTGDQSQAGANNVTSSSSPAASQADSASQTGSASPDTGSRPSWLGPLAAFFLALALGFLVLARTAGVSLANLRPSLARDAITRRPGSPTLPPRGPGAPPRGADPVPPSSIAMSEVRLDDQTAAGVDAPYRPVVLRNVAGRRSRAPVATARPNKVFQSHYRIGDDPFEEIHPIADPRTGGLIAACGLTATLRLDSVRSGGYYAFTAWIQDYSGGDELHAAGLVAPGSTEIARGAIDSWVRSGQVDTVLPLEAGTTTNVGTDEIRAAITVVDVSYGRDERVVDAYVTGLTLRFEIQQGDLDDDAS